MNVIGFLCVSLGSRDSVVGIATGYELTTKESEFESGYGQEFSLLRVVQTGSGVQPASYPMSAGGSFPRVKRQGREADHWPPTSAEIKKNWIYTSTSLPFTFYH
jgi:hypothetical protein